jgi:branched-chain amino acid transport system substrate-binding protein
MLMKKYLLILILHSYLVLPVPTFADAQPIKIGATLMLTGYGAPWGKNAQQGMELAVSEVNEAGGVNGRPLKIVYEDFGELDLKRAATAAHKLIDVDQVNLIFSLIIEDSEVVVPIASKKGVATISVGCGLGGKLSGVIYPLFFRATSSDDVLADLGIDYAKKENKQNACVVGDKVRYYETMADHIASTWKKRTGITAKVYEYPWGTTDFSSLMTKIKAAKCDVLFLETGIPAQGVFLKQANELKIAPLFIGPPSTDDPSVISVAGSSANGVVFGKFTAGSPEFVMKYKSRYNELPSRPSATSYDAVKLAAKAIGAVGTDAEKVAKYLRGVTNFQGVSGSITLDENGDREGEIPGLYFIQDGQTLIMKK